MRNLSRFKASQPSRGNSQSLGAGRKLGPYFKCGEFGHLSVTCAKDLSASAPKAASSSTK